MSKQGVGRVRWIRLLAVVLALTASRNNFPITGWTVPPAAETSNALSAKNTPSPKKYEGVIPSRRSLESRRTSLHEAASPDGSAQAASAQANDLCLAPTGWFPSPDRNPRSVIGADPVALLLRASHVSSLPPPV